MKDHLSWETTLTWQKGRSLKTGTTVVQTYETIKYTKCSYVGSKLIISCSISYPSLEIPLPWETACLDEPLILAGGHTFQCKCMNLSPKNSCLEIIFLWPMGRSFKTGCIRAIGNLIKACTRHCLYSRCTNVCVTVRTSTHNVYALFFLCSNNYQ